MGLASALDAPLTMGLRWAPFPGTADRLLLGLRQAHLITPIRSRPRSTSTLTFARRRDTNATITPSPKNNNNKLQRLSKKDDIEEEEDIDDIDDDALEALFDQLEEDLKNDDPSLFDGDGEELTEEDLEKLNRELEEIDEEISKVFDMTGFESEDDDDDEILEETDDDDDDDEQPLNLKDWQLRRLALALKTGRRKTNIKSLAAELCIDRSIVLGLLRNPPPSFLMLSAALPDNDEPSSQTITVAETPKVETVVAETTPEPDAAAKVPVHVMQERFSSQKKIKKAHIQTLEDVYRRSKRLTNAMIQSIVAVTNLPRRRVVKWFEDKRAEEGLPEDRGPYRRSVPETPQ